MIKPRSQSSGLRLASSLLFVGALIAATAIASLQAAGRASEESRRVLEQNLRRAAIQCYALEGFYPGNEQYLEQEYGVVVNHEKYLVHYEGFASNLMPDISVTEK